MNFPSRVPRITSVVRLNGLCFMVGIAFFENFTYVNTIGSLIKLFLGRLPHAILKLKPDGFLYYFDDLAPARSFRLKPDGFNLTRTNSN